MAEPTFSPVTSSNVKRVGKCADGHLYVEFQNGGLYRWDGQAATHHDALVANRSPGRYLRDNLAKGVKV